MTTPIELGALNYTFLTKPLLVGGKAMEYYGLRVAGKDIDFIVSSEDYERLAERFSHNIKVRFENWGVCVGPFEFWKSLVLFQYDFLSVGSVEEDDFRVISLEKLLFLEALAIADPKNEEDLRLIVRKIHDIQYGRARLPEQ